MPRLGAPAWHGKNVNALLESMVWGDISAIEPPYTLRIHATKNLPSDVAERLGRIMEGLADAREEFKAMWGRDVDVDIEIVS